MLIRLLIILLLASGVFGGAYYAIHRLYLEPERKLQADKQLPPPAPPPDPSLEEFVRCEEVRRTSPPEAARVAFERFLKEYPDSKKRDDALNVIGELNSVEFFAMKPDDANVYVVKPGDSLSRVASRTKLSMEFLVHMNKLQRDLLHPGQRLLAPPCDFHLTLRQKTRKLVLTNGGKFFRQYPTLTWPGANKAGPIFLPKQSGKLIDKLALGEKGVAVKPTEIGYFGASHTLTLSIPGHTIYSQSPEGTPGRLEGRGIALAPAHASEIAILLPRGAPVTME